MNPKQRKKPDILKRKLKQIKTDCKKVQDQHCQGISNQAEDNLHPQAEESSNDGVVDIENLPVELVMEIFKYLNLNDLCRVGRVCKTWHEMTRSRIYWERIQANIGECSLSIPEATFQLISILPSFVTCISLNFKKIRNSYILFNEFSKKLREKCPNLQILVLRHITFATETDEIVQLCTKLPKDISVLALPYCAFYMRGVADESDDTVSNIEVLDLSECSQKICSHFSFTHMPNLKKLHLAGSDLLYDEDFFTPIGYFIDQLEILNLERTPTCSITFQTITNHSQHLTELYVCWTMVQDHDLIFIEEQKAFSCLKIICLRGCDVTTVGVYSLIKSCPTLQKIFVGSNELMIEDGTSWDLEKVEDLGFGYCDHSKKVNYMLK